MLSKTLMLAATVVAMSALAANAQSNSSNPTEAPTTGGAAKTESPGTNAQVPGPAKSVNPNQSSSSNPTEAPTSTGGIAKTEAPGANAQVPGPAKQPDPSQSSSTPSQAPTGTSK
jgi:hypothetical protein